MPPRLTAPDRRRQILRCATAVFARSNYRAAGVAEIAREAGVSEPLLYKHFASKKAIFIEILGRVGARIVEIWEEAIAGAPDALTALRIAGEVYIENMREHPAEARLQFQALAEASDPEIAAVLQSNHRAYVELFERLLEQGRREGVIRADVDPHAAAWLLNGTGFTFTLMRLLDFDGAVSSAARAEPVMTSLLEWLAAPAAFTDLVTKERT